MDATRVCICGNEFTPESDAHRFCSQHCYMDSLDSTYQAVGVAPSREYYQHIPFEEPVEAFPLLVGVNERAERFGSCQDEDWGNVLAHAHHDLGWICVRGAADPNLWDGESRPTSLFLHEYAHLMVPGGHIDEFWGTNKELHEQYKVTHARFEDALGSVVGGVLFAGLGIGLYIFTGWGWFGIGAAIGIVFAIPALLNSFGAEQHETQERECGTNA